MEKGSLGHALSRFIHSFILSTINSMLLAHQVQSTKNLLMSKNRHEVIKKDTPIKMEVQL